MLDRVFMAVLNMSLTGSLVVLLILFARLLLRRAPRVFSFALWSVAWLRLLCPFSFESKRSLLPVHAQTVGPELLRSSAPEIDSGLRIIDRAVNPLLPAPVVGASVNPLQIWLFVGEIIWILGMLMMITHSVASLFHLRARLIGAASVAGKKRVYLADHIDMPFVLGILRPCIYLPSFLGESARALILQHEHTHLRRLDHVTKMIGFGIVVLHWFNPFVWLAFSLFCRDMEISCDEAVMRDMKADMRAEYSALLLGLSTGRRVVAGMPLAFSEGDTKGRIKHVLSYRRSTFWVSAAALLTVVAVCTVGCVSRARSGDEQGRVIQDTQVSGSGDETIADADNAVAEDYKNELRLSFPLTEDEIPETFALELTLPDGWVAEAAGEAKEKETPPDAYYLYYCDPSGGSKTYKGTVSFSTAEWVEEGKENYRMYYQGYMGGSVVSWDCDYAAVIEDEEREYGSATCTVYVKQLDTSAAAAGADVLYYPAVLAYRRVEDKILQIAIQLQPGAVSENQQRNIAEHIAIDLFDS